MQAARDPQLEGDPDPAIEALRALVEEIEHASFFDQQGRLLELSPAFLEARDLVYGYPSN